MGTYIGDTVRLTTKDGTYDGVVQSLDVNSKRITLESVFSVNFNKKLSGVSHFYGPEIVEIDVKTSRSKKKEKVSYDDNEGPHLMRKEREPMHLKKLRDVENEVYLKHRVVAEKKSAHNQDNVKTIAIRLKQFPPHGDLFSQRKPSKRPTHYVLLDTINQSFHAAIEYLTSQSIIGVAMEGMDLGRKGKLCWIQMASKEFIFLFDILSLDEACMESGIGYILQNPKIQKVIHNCRRLSDLMYHGYNVTMANIFDTQVAHIMVERFQNDGTLPKFVPGLFSCLFQHLPNINAEDVHVERIRQDSKEEDQSVWAHRPASETVLDAALKNVIYLRELRVILTEKMLQEFVEGVDIYLGARRDISEERLDIAQDHLIPKRFRNLMVLRRELRNQPMMMRNNVDKEGYSEHIQRVFDPAINISQAGIWHSRSQETDKSNVTEAQNRDGNRDVSFNGDGNRDVSFNGDGNRDVSFMNKNESKYEKDTSESAKTYYGSQSIRLESQSYKQLSQGRASDPEESTIRKDMKTSDRCTGYSENNSKSESKWLGTDDCYDIVPPSSSPYKKKLSTVEQMPSSFDYVQDHSQGDGFAQPHRNMRGVSPPIEKLKPRSRLSGILASLDKQSIQENTPLPDLIDQQSLQQSKHSPVVTNRGGYMSDSTNDNTQPGKGLGRAASLAQYNAEQ